MAGGRAIARGRVVLEADTRGLDRDMRGAHERFRRTSHEITGDADKMARGVLAASGAFGHLSRSLAFASTSFLGGASVGFAVKTAFDEMAKGQKVAAQTNAVLASTAKVAGVTAGEVSRLGLALMKKSGIDDEAIKTGENMLLTFTNIRNVAGASNDIFNQATRATLDLSVAMGQDMQQSAIQLGKALNDPIRGVTALQRIGVTFTQGQRAQIKALVDSGRTLEAQKVILHELNKEFGGSAAAAGQTLPGKLSILRQSLLNTAGDIATQLSPTIIKLADDFQGWIDHAQRTHQIERDVNAVVKTGKTIFADFRDVVVTVKGPLEDLNRVLAETHKAFDFSTLLGKHGTINQLFGPPGGRGILGDPLAGLLGHITGVDVSPNAKGPSPYRGVTDVQRGIVGTAVSVEHGPNARYVYGGGGAGGPTAALGARHDKFTFAGFDCSGFVQYVMARNGISVPRTSQQQAAQGVAVPPGEMAPGDLVFTEGWPHPGHVGIYVGNGMVIEDPHTGASIRTVTLGAFGFNGHAVRYWKKGTVVPKGKTVPPDASHSGTGTAAGAPLIPARFDRDIARASTTPGLADDKLAAQAELNWIRARLAKGGLSIPDQTTLYDRESYLIGQLAGKPRKIKPWKASPLDRANVDLGVHDPATNQAERARIAAIRGAQQAAVDVVGEGTLTGATSVLDAIKAIRSGMRRETVKGIGDVLMPYTATIADWKKIQDDVGKLLKRAYERRAKIQGQITRAKRLVNQNKALLTNLARELVAVNRLIEELQMDYGEAAAAIKDLGGQSAAAGNAEAAAILAARSGFLASFAPNIFHQTPEGLAWGSTALGTSTPVSASGGQVAAQAAAATASVAAAVAAVLPATTDPAVVAATVAAAGGNPDPNVVTDSTDRAIGRQIVINQHISTPATEQFLLLRKANFAARSAFD